MRLQAHDIFFFAGMLVAILLVLGLWAGVVPILGWYDHALFAALLGLIAGLSLLVISRIRERQP